MVAVSLCDMASDCSHTLTWVIAMAMHCFNSIKSWSRVFTNTLFVTVTDKTGKCFHYLWNIIIVLDFACSKKQPFLLLTPSWLTTLQAKYSNSDVKAEHRLDSFSSDPQPSFLPPSHLPIYSGQRSVPLPAAAYPVFSVVGWTSCFLIHLVGPVNSLRNMLFYGIFIAY